MIGSANVVRVLIVSVWIVDIQEQDQVNRITKGEHKLQ